MPPTPHEAAAAPESSHSCCVGKYGNTTVQVMHNARHRPLLPACARRPPVIPGFPPGPRPLRTDCQAPRVRLGRRVLWRVCGTGMAQAAHAARINAGTRHQRLGVEPVKRNCQDCTARRAGCHATCERYKADCAQDAKRRAYEKQFAYMDSMPQTATALKKTLAPRRVGGQQ